MTDKMTNKEFIAAIQAEQSTPGKDKWDFAATVTGCMERVDNEGHRRWHYARWKKWGFGQDQDQEYVTFDGIDRAVAYSDIDDLPRATCEAAIAALKADRGNDGREGR